MKKISTAVLIGALSLVVAQPSVAKPTGFSTETDGFYTDWKFAGAKFQTGTVFCYYEREFVANDPRYYKKEKKTYPLSRNFLNPFPVCPKTIN